MDSIQITELMPIIISVLPNQFFEMNRPCVDTSRSTCFHPICLESQCNELLRDAIRSRFGGASSGYLRLAAMHQSVEEGTIGQHDRSGFHLDAQSSLHAAYLIIFDNKTYYDILPDR